MRGLRGRLLVTVVGLVALTSLVLGSAGYAYVATSLRDQQLREATAQTNFNVAVLADQLLPARATRSDVTASGLFEALQLRGGVGTVVDLGDGDPIASGFTPAAAFGTLSAGLRAIVASGQIGYERVALDGRPYLVTGARRPGAAPGPLDFYFFFDARETEEAIARLGQALLVAGLALVGVAALAGGAVTRGLLRPVRAAGLAAERIASGDLSARLEVASDDEFGRWAASFNRMAASLAATIAELRAMQARQRAFVADVSHELRTPLTALVHEAALLRDHLGHMPPDARRAGELLVSDVARLRALVDDLMEISRFDAAAEALVLAPLELGDFVRVVALHRAPGATVQVPDRPVVVVADRRRVERILGNLVDNAREHGQGRDVTISLHAHADSDVVRLVVADRGPGIEPDQLPRLFERFHKGDPSRRLGGSGLGLAIAREHAELLGGSLEASVRPGGGLAVELRLPVTQPLPGGDSPVTPRDDSPTSVEPASELRP